MWVYEKKVLYTSCTYGKAKSRRCKEANPSKHRRFYYLLEKNVSSKDHLKLSTDTYPVTYFPAGVIPQFSAVVVMRYRPFLQAMPS